MAGASAGQRRARRDTDVVLGVVGAVANGFLAWFFMGFDGAVGSPLPPVVSGWVSGIAAALVLVSAGLRWFAARLRPGVVVVVLGVVVLWLLVLTGFSLSDHVGAVWLTVGGAVATSVLAAGIRAERSRSVAASRAGAAS